jgi:hypothetical protein
MRIAPAFLCACLVGCGPGFVPLDSRTDTGDDDGGEGASDVPLEPFCGDGVVSEGEQCDDAAPGECTTGCGSTGTEDCVGCVVMGCLEPEESCNREDDDCDDVVDEDLTDCRCTDGGEPWDHEECNDIDDDCNGAVDDGLADCRCTDDDPLDHEECNDVDDDCDGEVDEDLTDCRCTDGGEPLDDEECNDIDDDCNGAVDDGLTDCRCTADDPLDHELCNRMDDDCDGEVDEDLTDCQCTDGSPTAEVCDRVDNDCDERIDEENTRTSPPGDCLEFGEECVPDRQECSSGLCVGDDFERYCSELCDPSAPDPPCTSPGYRCYDDPDPTADDYCKRNYASCDHEAACPGGESCAVVVADDGLTLVTECRPDLGTGVLDDSCTTDDDCTTGECHRDTFCTEVCRTSSDCGSGHECIMVSLRAPSDWQFVPLCMYACGDDTDCTVGTLTACQPGATPTGGGAYAGEGYCSVLYTGTGRVATGEDCDHYASPPIFCDHAICSDSGTGVCTEVCDDTSDCGLSGWTCISSSVTFGAPIGSVSMRVCDPP